MIGQFLIAKEKTADKIVVYKNGDFFYDFEKNRGKYNPNEILGNLKDLNWEKYVKTN